MSMNLSSHESGNLIPISQETTMPQQAELHTSRGYYHWLKTESGLFNGNRWAESAVSITAMKQWFAYYEGRVKEVDVENDLRVNSLGYKVTDSLLAGITESELAYQSSHDVAKASAVAKSSLDALKQSDFYAQPDLFERRYHWYAQIDRQNGPTRAFTQNDKQLIELYTVMLEGLADPVESKDAKERVRAMGSVDRMMRNDDLWSSTKLLRLYLELRLHSGDAQKREEVRQRYNELKATELYNTELDEWNLFQTSKHHYYPPYLTPQLIDVLLIQELDGEEKAQERMDFLQGRYQRPNMPAGMWIHTVANAGPLDRSFHTDDQMLLTIIKGRLEHAHPRQQEQPQPLQLD